MGATHFLTRTLDKVRTEMSVHVLAYNLRRMIGIFGVGAPMARSEPDRLVQAARASLAIGVSAPSADAFSTISGVTSRMSLAE
jgi:hypothetical protein